MRKSYKFRAYPNIGARKRIYRNMRYGVTPVWNACIAEREKAREKYRERLNNVIEKTKSELDRDLTDEEKTKIKEELNKKLKAERFWPTAYDQYKHVKKSEHPEYANFSAVMLQCTAGEVDAAEKSFLALWTKGDKDARPPRQQIMHRKIMFRQSGWKPLKPETGRVWLNGIGWLKFKLHRPIEGTVKAVTISQKNCKYYISFSCEIDDLTGACSSVNDTKPIDGNSLRQKHTSTGGSDPENGGAYNCQARSRHGSIGGSDPENGGAYNGLAGTPSLLTGGSDPEKRDKIELVFGFRDNIFIADSEGRIIKHPAFYQSCLDRLADLNKRLDRKHFLFICQKCGHKHRKKPFKNYCKGCKERVEFDTDIGNNWKKAKYTLQKFHEKIANKRAYFLWHIARFYAGNYKTIVVPNWPLKKQIEYASNNETAIRLTDGAYSKLIEMLRHKCGEFGSKLIIGPENKELKKRAKKLDKQKAKLKKTKRMLKKANIKLRKEAI